MVVMVTPDTSFISPQWADVAPALELLQQSSRFSPVLERSREEEGGGTLCERRKGSSPPPEFLSLTLLPDASQKGEREKK